MRQDQLTQEAEKCDHGFFFGTTCEHCQLASAQDRIRKALNAVSLGSFDGGHHKMYAIDQILRELTGCPTLKKTTKDSKGVEFTYEVLGESPEYLAWVKEFEGEPDEEGEKQYEWDVGTPP